MAKGELSRKKTQVHQGNGELVGQQEEQTVMVDDCCLPNASELQAYSEINPDIVSFLMEISKKEQDHRHAIESKKVEIVKENNKYSFTVNSRGMLYAFLTIFVCAICSVFLIFTDKNIAGSIFAGSTLLTAIAIFRPRSNNHKESDQKK